METLADPLKRAGDMIATTFRKAGKVLLLGNGGSATDALHVEGELLGRYRLDRKGLPALALGGGIASLTAVANDYGYDAAMARFAQAHLKPGDVVLAYSTSGESDNVIEAARSATRAGAKVIAFTGEHGGRLASHCDLLLNVPSRDTPRIQEMHGLMGHILCDLVERAIFAEGEDDLD